MPYMLMFYQPAAEFEQRDDASSQAYRANWIAYADAVRQSGISLGGYFVVDVPDLDAALEWAASAPCAASGGVEVRPVFTATAIAAATP